MSANTSSSSKNLLGMLVEIRQLIFLETLTKEEMEQMGGTNPLRNRSIQPKRFLISGAKIMERVTTLKLVNKQIEMEMGYVEEKWFKMKGVIETVKSEEIEELVRGVMEGIKRRRGIRIP